jgi:hypothetical protein
MKRWVMAFSGKKAPVKCDDETSHEKASFMQLFDA